MIMKWWESFIYVPFMLELALVGILLKKLKMT